jgi:uracil-DNA glycosylase
MSTNKYNKLSEYNTKIFDALSDKCPHFQLGFFNGNEVLFVGQNPGNPSTDLEKAITEKVMTQKTFRAFEKEYEDMIKMSKIGQYLDPTISGQWSRVSFTNVVKTTTPGNMEPDDETYEMFFPMLMQQIEILEPNIIACLGKYAGAAFGLTEFYHAVRYKGSVVCMYPHPSFVRRNGRDAMLSEQVKMKISLEELHNWAITARHTHESQS